MKFAKSRFEYNPTFCKTCQNQQRRLPKIARVQFSDCDEHFHQRIRRLVLTGGVYYA
ncbi:MAG: hypothetical protein OK439_00570 [Thaumarchaeota archaeon]|nr:hypothetical protein [Nitrososphaerota archaeon]